MRNLHYVLVIIASLILLPQAYAQETDVKGGFFDKKTVVPELSGGSPAPLKPGKTKQTPAAGKKEDSFAIGEPEKPKSSQPTPTTAEDPDVSDLSKRSSELQEKLKSSGENPGVFSPEYLDKVMKALEETTNSTDSPKQKKNESYRF